MAEKSIAVNVSLVNGVPMVTTLEVAERFGKPHADVLKAVRKLIGELPPEFGQGNFSESSYINEQSKEQPMYNLTRDAFSLLAMGFTGKAALAWKVKYIEAFNGMEAELLKLAKGKKSVSAQQASLPRKDKYIAYIEEVEAFRQKTAAGIEALVREGLHLVDVRKFGPGCMSPFASTLVDWLQKVTVSVSPVISSFHTPERVLDYCPIGIFREMEKDYEWCRGKVK